MDHTESKAASLLALLREASRDDEVLHLLRRCEIALRPTPQRERWPARVDVVFRVIRPEPGAHEAIAAQVRLEHAARSLLGATVRFVRWEFVRPERGARAGTGPPESRPLRRPTPRRPLGRWFMRQDRDVSGGRPATERAWRAPN